MQQPIFSFSSGLICLGKEAMDSIETSLHTACYKGVIELNVPHSIKYYGLDLLWVLTEVNFMKNGLSTGSLQRISIITVATPEEFKLLSY